MSDYPNWLQIKAKALSIESKSQAQARQQQLTKPQGSLGQLEQIAVDLAAMQGRAIPELEQIYIRIFAADHGIATQPVSAYPQAVTAQMIANFSQGGAAITVLAKQLDADFQVINLGTVEPLPELPLVNQQIIAASTADFSQQPAMTDKQLNQALTIGYQSVQSFQINSLFVAGEMGIGNTSAATAISAALLQQPAQSLVGAGTGLQPEQITAKSSLIQQALDLHQLTPAQPLNILQTVGGFEIAALVGAYLAAAEKGISILVDGFISSAAMAIAQAINPELKGWCFYAHCSAEYGHKILLEHMQATPLLNLDMRLGEGSGAAVAVNILHSAWCLHKNMATFADAAVSESL